MNKTILAVAILTMAAFAGVMIVGDDTDAEGESVAPTKVVYQIDVYSFEYPIVDGSFTVKDIADFDIVFAGTFKSWKVATSSVTYLPGQTVSITGITTADGKYVLKAEIDQKAYFYAGEEIVATIDNGAASTLAFPTNGDAAVAIFEEQTVETGYTFKGWMSGDKLYKVVKNNETNTYALKLIKSDGTYGVVDDILGMTFTASVQKNYGVAWVVDGTQIAKGDVVSNNIPVAPVKANYNFLGWGIDGKVVIAYNAGLISESDDGYRIDGKSITESKYFEGVTADIQFDAIFEPVQLTVTFQVGEFSSTQTVLYGAKAMKPVLPEGYVAWMLGEEEFNFDTPITENITLTAKAGEVAQIYTITFEIVDKAPVIQKSDSMVIPDTAREGYMFQGWVVKGQSQYVDPAELVKTITSDITFVAVYKAVEVVEFTVTFVNGDEVVDTVKVVKDALVDEIDAPEGMFWLFDFETPITADITIEAKPLTVTVQFAVGEKVYNAYTQTVAYGEKIDVTKLADFIFPEGFDSWNYDFNEPVTADMTVFAKAIPAPEKEPAFYQTPMGQCAIVLAVFVVGLILFGVFTGKIELPKFKVSRVKPEEPEQVEEEKKP